MTGPAPVNALPPNLPAEVAKLRAELDQLKAELATLRRALGK